MSHSSFSFDWFSPAHWFSAAETKHWAHWLDPFGVWSAPWRMAQTWLGYPEVVSGLAADYGRRAWDIQWQTWQAWLGQPSVDVEQAHPDDLRFQDPIWQTSPSWRALKQHYLLATHMVQDSIYSTPQLSANQKQHAAFWVRQWQNSLAPTNFFWTNPVAMRRAVESGGQSLWQGWQLWCQDLQAGDVSMTDRKAFQVGGNLAQTPGDVVFRNEMLEVIRYRPAQKVHAQPLVLVSPWINKFYILDLNPQKSMVRHLVEQGYDVYITSWRNPGREQAHWCFADYLQQGVAEIVRVAREISGAEQVNLVGYCIGGTLVTCYMAWLAARAEQPVASWTLLTTLVDFADPGDIRIFIDAHSLQKIDDLMQQQGYLDGRQMASAFRMLRPNSLIWPYVAQQYLMGETPPAFDVLFWNMDNTRMPQTMHSEYLHTFYLHNRLIQAGGVRIGDVALDLRNIQAPLYCVGTEDDHIAPWRSTFSTVHRVGGPVHYVLTSSGHILGIINPPPAPKRQFRASTVQEGESAEQWQQRVQVERGSWWSHWLQWLEPHAGPQQSPKKSRRYPALEPAPGSYVHG